MLVDNVSKAKIVESIGIRYFIMFKDTRYFDTYIHVSNIRGDLKYHNEKQMEVKDVQGSFAVENILSANKEKNCLESSLKDWISDCIRAELRPLSPEERSQLDELNGKAFGLPVVIKSSC